MRDLVRDDVAARLRRREDQPPAEADPPLRRAAAPARAGIADGHRLRRDANLEGELSDFARHGVERQTLEKEFNAARKACLRSTAPQLAVNQLRRTPRTFRPDDPRLDAFDRDLRSRHERLGR